MRTRTTTSPMCPVIGTREYTWNKAVTPWLESSSLHPYAPNVQNWMVPNGYPQETETIQDELGTDGRFRDCFHTHQTNSFSGPDVKHRFYRGWGGNAYLRNITANICVDAAVALRTAPSIDMNAYAEQALAFMLPRLNEGTSLVNSLLELKDLKRMDPRGVLSRLRYRRTALRDLANKRYRSQFTRELITRLNNAVLNTSFGIVPLVADIIQIHDDLVELAGKLERLKKYANTQQQRHYKRVIPASAGMPASRDWVKSDTSINWPSGFVSDNLDNGGLRRPVFVRRQARWVRRPVYHATMRYYYTLPSADSRLEELYSYLDVLGVRIDPGIVWNAIPFSFVIDWIVDVSSFLRSFARDNYPIELTIVDFCHSYAWHLEAMSHVAWTCDLSIETLADIHPGYPTRPGWHGIYQGTRKHYSRVRAFPNIHTARVKGPKLRQAALAGSLLLAQTSYGRATRYQTGLESNFLRVRKNK